MNTKDFEIMAPVGSRESLAAAIQAGADSIYFGIENLNMRARSANTFTIDDLKEIARTCEEHGMKSYLTVNTIIYDNDLALMRTIVDAAHEAGISAIIQYATQHQQRGGVALLCPVCRCRGAGARTELRAGGGHPSRH